MSGSARPTRSSPSWLKITSAEVGDIIAKLAKKGMTPSQIGVLLRDNHGVAQVNSVTNSKILRILKGQGPAPTLPEDLYCPIGWLCPCVPLERNRKDMAFRLIPIESGIHSLARYHKLAKKLALTGSTTPPPPRRPPPKRARAPRRGLKKFLCFS